ncbi:GIY-YIG nuclease family protein [Sorangium sp. So ce1014]|uniref:GIY-YIG nuclease family protein n=1 Tax=Sorangium sp. So ce1014 TaxID=3133326 RepID=UPI003F60C798
MGMFNSAGLMWSSELVGWGSPGRNPTCELLGYYAGKLSAQQGRGALSELQRKRQTLNFWDVPGVYALYKGDTTVYVGQANRIGDRLLAHYRTDHLVGRWDAFSWVSPVDIAEKIDSTKPQDIEQVPLPQGSPVSGSMDKWLDEVEALLILLAKPLDNRQNPSFGDHTWLFTQIRSDHASATQAEMIEQLYNTLVLKQKVP